MGLIFSILFIPFIILVLKYVLVSYSVYQMGINTGMPNSWYGWVPILREVYIGQLGDRYNDSQGKHTRYDIIMGCLYLVKWFIIIVVFCSMNFLPTIMAGLFSIVPLLSISSGILRLYVDYLVFKDFEPTQSGLYTVLCLIGLDFIVYFLIRDNVTTGITGNLDKMQPKFNK